MKKKYDYIEDESIKEALTQYKGIIDKNKINAIIYAFIFEILKKLFLLLIDSANYLSFQRRLESIKTI